MNTPAPAHGTGAAGDKRTGVHPPAPVRIICIDRVTWNVLKPKEQAND